MKKIVLVIIFIFLLLGFSEICWAQQQIGGPYPPIRTNQGTFSLGPNTPIDQVVKYIYVFALAAVGFAALLAIMIGAVMYVTSAGNASKAADAKDRIMAAVLGILLLIASVLILQTISPDLASFGEPRLPSITPGNGIPSQARACFCIGGGASGAFERCYADANTCLNQCSGYCQLIYTLTTTGIGICNIDTTNCP